MNELERHDLDDLLDLAVTAARRAAVRISETPPGSLSVERKAAGSSEASQVVSQLDREAQALILDTLHPSFTEFHLALLTEESEDDQSRFERDFFWCVDPLDGTLPFLEGQAGYAVSLALVTRAGLPVLAVVAAPATEELYTAIRGRGVWRNGEALPPGRHDGTLHLFSDRSLAQDPRYPECLATLETLARDLGLEAVRAEPPAGAVMNAIGMLQHARACYLKFPRSQPGGGSIWDYAATACILDEAGACATDFVGKPLKLNRPETTFMHEDGILFASGPELHRRLQMAAGAIR